MNSLIKECERQIVHPSATQALYVGVWARTRVEKIAVLLLSSVASTKPLVRSPVLGLPGNELCHAVQEGTAELEEGYFDQHTRCHRLSHCCPSK